MDYIPADSDSLTLESPTVETKITLARPDGAEQIKVFNRASDGIYKHKLQLTPEVLRNMTTHAEAAFPNECCGFFYGKEGKIREVHRSRAVENSISGDQRRRFEISPLDYMKAERFALNNGLDLLGIYHSHPNHVALPSVHDQKQAVPFFSYIIVSVKEGKTDHVLSWQLNDDGVFEEEEVLVEKY